jgi:glycosyltransferase involved in cell wall biosynthesis
LLLQPSTKRKFLLPAAISDFSLDEKEAFVNYIETHNIDTLFFRHISFCELAYYAKEKLPSITIIVDEDFRMSRLMQQSWQRRPSLSSRYFFIEYHKLNYYESKLHQSDFAFSFSNLKEVEDMRMHYPDTKIIHMPNTTDLKVHKPQKSSAAKSILFYGAMDSITNKEGYRYIHDEVYPLIKEKLTEYGYSIHIVGKGCQKLTPSKYDDIKIMGKVDSIEETILESDFVILPIFVASGTNTRVIETAMAGKALITTPLGAEGLFDAEGTRFVVESAKQMAEQIICYLEDSQAKLEDAILLQREVAQNFSVENFNHKLNQLLEQTIKLSR